MRYRTLSRRTYKRKYIWGALPNILWFKHKRKVVLGTSDAHQHGNDPPEIAVRNTEACD